MTIENQKSQEQNEKVNAWVEAKGGISPENTKKLAEDLDNLDNSIEQILQSKINFLNENDAGFKDKAKWIYLENQTEGMTQDYVISKILKLWLVSENDIRTLTKDKLTKLIQTKMYEKIALNPDAYAKLNNYLQSESKIKWLNIWMPNAWSQTINWKLLPASDGKFGPRSYFVLDLLISIPPATVPPTVSEKAPPVNRWSFRERLFQPESFVWMQSLTPVYADTYYFKWWINIVFKSNKSTDETPVQPTFTIKDNWDNTEFYLGTKLITVAPKDKVPNFYSNVISIWAKSIRPHLFTENNIKKAVDNYSKGRNNEAQQYLRYGNATDADSLLKKEGSLEWMITKK